ncbi:MAG: hypothetical protein Q4A15_08965, partial [Prevotellaceae bacterium]|nr:hypothetical protein [Prevotellaceae bacterium]
MEEKVKDLIRESLNKRLEGNGNIDNLMPNYNLIENWLTAIMAIAYNDNDLELASQDINEIQEKMYGPISIEDTRAFVFLSSNRFPDEITAFEKYIELRDRE